MYVYGLSWYDISYFDIKSLVIQSQPSLPTVAGVVWTERFRHSISTETAIDMTESKLYAQNFSCMTLDNLYITTEFAYSIFVFCVTIFANQILSISSDI
jgi:hypothetical protein